MKLKNIGNRYTINNVLNLVFYNSWYGVNWYSQSGKGLGIVYQEQENIHSL